MSIPSEVSPRVTVAGPLTSVTVPFRFLDPADLVVVKSVSSIPPTQTVLVEGADYTLAGSVVTPTETVQSGEYITITRRTPIIQPIALREQGVVNLALYETALDRLTMIAQELNLRISDLEAL